jgi:acyl-CoA synthetase (NDP forming)
MLDPIRSPEVVLKIVSPDIFHKSDVGGIAIVPRDADQVNAAARSILEEVGKRALSADLRGILVVERISFDANQPGSEYLLSMRRDPFFGPVLMFGIGGLLTEWYGRLSAAATRVLVSASDFDLQATLAAIDATPLGQLALHPGRIHARAPIDPDLLGAALQGLAQLATAPSGSAAPLLDEVEINPLAVVDGRLIALDALARLGEPLPTARPPRPIATIRHLLHPRSAAVFGASSRSMNAGRIILRNLKSADGVTYGHLYAVHPKAESIDGVPCYPNTAALPERVDLAVVSIPARGARDAIADLVQQDKTRSIILIPGGFAETGESQLASEIQDQIIAGRSGESGGPVMVGGNCLGIVSKGEFNTFFLPQHKLPFHDAPGESLVVVSQSGAYLVSFTSNLDGIIFPRASISYGNEMDLTAGDFLEYYLEHEPEARTFSFYIEGFAPGEGKRFADLVRQATESGRAVVVYKAGMTSHGARAAASHTASMAGDYEVARSLLSNAGSEMRIIGRRVGVVTNAGFEAGAVSDSLYGLELATLAAQTQRALASHLPSIAHIGNPVDTTPMADTASFIKAVEVMSADPGVDMLIVSAIPATPTLEFLAPDLSGAHAENIFAMGSLPAELIRLHHSIRLPMVAAIDSGRLYDPSVVLLERNGIPVYRKIDRASRALSTFAHFHLDLKGASRRPS